MFGWITHLFGLTKTSPIRKPRPKFRLGCEALEARDVPATFWWLGQFTTDATTAANWRNDFEFGPSSYVPGPGDDVYFTSDDMGGNVDCDNFGEAGAYRSITVTGYYSSTITLSEGFTTQGFAMHGGDGAAVDQPTSGTDIIVEGPDNGGPSFVWTNGEINSTEYRAKLTVTGEDTTALINPDDEDPLELGSDMNFEDESEGEFLDANLDGHNDPIVTVGEGCDVDVRIQSSNNVVWSGVKQINVDSSSYFRAIGPGTAKTWDANASLNNRGEVKFLGLITVNFSGQVFVPNALNNSYYQVGTGAQTFIESGSTVGVANPMVIFDGHLSTLYNSNLADTVAAQKATIQGNLLVNGGNVVICDGSSPHKFGKLYVSGDVDMTGGTYRPVIDGTTSGHCDQWECGGAFRVNPQPGGTASLAPGTVGNVIPNGTWRIIISGNGYTGTFASMSLVYDPNANPPKSYTVGTLGNPVNTFTLNS